MDWARYKNIAILSFIIINIVLYFLISDKKNNEYVTKDIQLSRMQKIFEAKNVGLYTNLPRDHFPKSMLIMRNTNINDKDVTKLFFGSDVGLKNYIDNEKIVFYKDGVGELDIYIDGKIKFIKKDVTSNSISNDKNQAMKLADNFLKTITFLKNSKYIPQMYTENGGYVIEYNKVYNDIPVFTNYIKIFVKNNKITSVEIFNLEVDGYTDEQKDIHSADEVLINLMYNVKEKYDAMNQEMHIMDLVLGYYITTDSVDEYETIKAEPYYRVLVNEKDVYFINAYTNEIVAKK